MASFGGAQAAPTQQGGLQYKWKVLISVIFGVFMIILDSTVVNVALRTLQSSYNASLSDAQWVISVYVLALGITTPLSGFLADRFGIKRIYVGGLALFVVGSLLCGIAPSVFPSSIWWLVAARALQGVGGGLAQPLGSSFIFSTFPPKEQGLALGIFGIALVAGPAMGPILGGYLVDLNLWQWIFFINVPIGILGVTLASLWLRERPVTRKPKPDPLGILTAVVGFGAVLFAASEVSEKGWGSSIVITAFIVGAISLLAFALIELFVAKEPLLDLRLFRNPSFLVASLIGYVSVIGLFGAEFLMPLYLQVLRGRSALQTGTMLLPIAISAAIATPISGRLYDKLGPRPLIVTGFTLLIINTWQLAQLQANTPISTILILLALRGLALGMTVQTTFATALGAVPRENLSRGSSLINGTRFVVQSIGVALLATVLTSGLSVETKELQSRFRSSTASTSTTSTANTHFGICESLDPVTGASVTGAANVPSAVKSLPPQVQAGAAKGITTACGEYVKGFEATYRVTFYAAIVALLIGFFLPGWPMKWAGRGSNASDGPPVVTAH